MSRSRSILFFAEEKSPMVEFIHKSIKEIYKELYPDFPPHIIKLGQYKNVKPVECYSSMFIFPNGEDLSYFGGEDVFGNTFEKYNSKYKLWALMGSSNTIFKDLDTGQESAYPIYYYRLLMEKINKSKLKNDVRLTCCYNDYTRSYPPLIRKNWTGKFL